MDTRIETGKKKRGRIFFQRLGLAALGLILGLSFYLINAKGLAGNQLPMPFGYGFAVVLSGSMEPALEVNDMIVVRESQDYQVGDIIVYQSGRTLVTHRVIQIDGSQVITQGDANNTADQPVDAAFVKGVVIGRIPAVGAWLQALERPFLIVVVFLCILLFSGEAFRKEKEEDEKQLEEIKEEIRRLRAEQADGAGVEK